MEHCGDPHLRWLLTTQVLELKCRQRRACLDLQDTYHLRWPVSISCVAKP